MKSRLPEPTLYFYILYPPLPWQWLWDNNFLQACPSKYLIELERVKNHMYYIQAYIQSIMYNMKVLQMISTASKIIVLLKWHYHKQNWTWNFVLIGMWVFGVFKITQINIIFQGVLY
jgi:hypothetical protein